MLFQKNHLEATNMHLKALHAPLLGRLIDHITRLCAREEAPDVLLEGNTHGKMTHLGDGGKSREICVGAINLRNNV